MLDHLTFGTGASATLLLLKGPDDEVSWNRVVWRRGSMVEARERTLWTSSKGLWNIQTDAALWLMSQATNRGWCTPARQAWRIPQLTIWNSRSDGVSVAASAISPLLEPELWRVRGRALSIVSQTPGEPGWAKAMVAWPDRDEVLLRTLRRRSSDADDLTTSGGWAINPVMMDVSTGELEVHLAALLQARGLDRPGG